MNKPMQEEVAELQAYYESKGQTEKANECAEILQLFYEMKMYPNQWAEMKRLAEQNRLLRAIGDIALF